MEWINEKRSKGDWKVTLWRPILLVSWLVGLGFFFAQVEIQIEGPNGWAASLPTWRMEGGPLLALFWGGKPLTGYHAWVFSFMALVFHLPMVLMNRWSVKLEARVLGSLMVFWIVEDFLWFVLNPAYGMSRFLPEHVTWHKHWVLGMPTDYPIFLILGGVLVWWSYWRVAPHPSPLPQGERE